MQPQEKASDSKEQFRQLRDAIINKPPYCSGTVPVQADELLIYYVKPEAHDDNARRINPLTASPPALEHLADACEPATFGLNDEDVLDESYRKAGKLDAHDFSVRLDLERNGLLDIVRAQLLPGRDTYEDVYAELYKLNVYGEGSFFKPHRDTPRGEAMLGTLVIIYPTRHEGGALIFRDGNEEWTFDSAKAVVEAAATGPYVAYATFYSDVEHEVTRVLQGHRITVTYNLYLINRTVPISATLTTATTPPAPTPTNPAPVPPPMPAPSESTGRLIFQSALEKLLADPSFLPSGGTLGFGLRRAYPLEKSSTSVTVRSFGGFGNDGSALNLNLAHLAARLKGQDRDVLRACAALGLRASLYMLYQEEDRYDERTLAVLVPRAPRLEGRYMEVEEESVVDWLVRVYKAKRIHPVTLAKDGIDYDDEEEKAKKPATRKKMMFGEEPKIDMEVHWVTKPTDFNVVKNTMVVYGNQADVGFAYGYISMIVKVGMPGARATAKK